MKKFKRFHALSCDLSVEFHAVDVGSVSVSMSHAVEATFANRVIRSELAGLIWRFYEFSHLLSFLHHWINDE
jgi:hypothetical protein